MSNNKVKGCDVFKRISVLIAITVMMTLLMGLLGCSGGPRQDPTDPVGSKPADKGTETERSSGIGPTPEPSGTTPSERYGRNGNIMEGLIDAGGGQGGDLLQNNLLAGVFDALTLEPIDDAYVSVGSEGTVYDQTDDVGCKMFTNFRTHSNFDHVGLHGIIVTAGADGYELKSYTNVTRSVIALLLEPIDPPAAPATATVYGTIEFNTEEFAGEVYSTHALSYPDRFLDASPGMTSDTFEITVEADIPGVFVAVWRDPDTDEILRVFQERIMPIDPGGSHEILPNYEEYYTDPATEDVHVLDSHKWFEWGALARDYSCFIDFNELEPDSLNAFFRYHTDVQYLSGTKFKTMASLDLNDKIEWPDIVFDPGEEYVEYAVFNSRIMPDYPQYIPFHNMSVWVDVEYDDGSGSIALVDYGRMVNPQGSLQLRTPPELTNTPIGLTPTLEWSLDSQDVFYPTKINMLDVSNETRWVVVTAPGVMTVTLPTLPSEMAGWGLSEGDEVMLRLTVEQSHEQTVTSADGTVTTIGNRNGVTPVNYSRLNTFIP